MAEHYFSFCIYPGKTFQKLYTIAVSKYILCIHFTFYVSPYTGFLHVFCSDRSI